MYKLHLAAKISALRVPRNIRTRGVTIAEHDPVIEKTVRIAVILREICEELNNFKGMNHTNLNLNSIKFHIVFITSPKTNIYSNRFRCVWSICNLQIEFTIKEKESTVL